MPKIISCSRRTDIPAFYTPWIMNRLRAGYCHTLNPFGGQVYRVSLLPEDVIGIFFWTRNPAPLLPHLNELDERGYRFAFNQTITGYPPGIETHNPPVETSITMFKKLADQVGIGRVHWRYDPILLSDQTPITYHHERFAAIARALEGSTDHCTFSFADFYGKTRRNLEHLERRTGNCFYDPSLEEKRSLVKTLAVCAAEHGMNLYSCCEDALLEGTGVQKEHCIGPEQVRLLRPDLDTLPGFLPTRKDCGCLASVDVGMYDTCLFGCSYCYATNSRAAAFARHAAHDPEDSMLWRPVELAGQDLDMLSSSRKS